jgi:hypothetical protein
VQALDAMQNYRKLTIWGFMGRRYKLDIVAMQHLWQCPECGEIHAIIRTPVCPKCHVMFFDDYRLDHSTLKTKMTPKAMWESFVSDCKDLEEYNMMDSRIVLWLDDLLKLSEPYIKISELFPVMLRDSPMMSTVLETIVYRETANANPRLVFPKRSLQFCDLVGGYTPYPVPGLHKGVISYDFHNLYPSVMSTFGLSPELVMLYKAWKKSGKAFDQWTDEVFVMPPKPKIKITRKA